MPKRVLAALCLVASMAVPVTRAQDAPGMVRVITTYVQLGHQEHYETVIPKLWDALKKAGGTGPIFVSAGVSNPSDYTFIMPISSFADIDRQEEQFGKAFAAAPEVASELFGIITSIDQSVWRSRPDLGYAPANPRLKDDEQVFTRIAFLYPRPGQEQAVEAVIKERSSLRQKHGATDPVNIAQMVIGSDGPAYAVLIGAKDELDYHTQATKNEQKMGAEWRATIAKIDPLLRRLEIVTETARPALFYQP